MAIIDLEDGVSASRKNDETRQRVAHALGDVGWRAQTLAIRVNAVPTEWCSRDIEVVVELAGRHLDCIVVPKVESTREIEEIDRLLSELDAEMGLEQRIGLEAQIESARGLVEVERIAASSPRLEALVFGPGDYAASLGVPQSSIGGIDRAYPGDQWQYARSRIATAAHAFGLQPIDGPYAAIRDLQGLRESAQRARLLGFQGKWVLHPDQIDVANDVFSPTREEIEHALDVLETLRCAADDEVGAALLDGVMIDAASGRLAANVIDRARAAGMEI